MANVAELLVKISMDATKAATGASQAVTGVDKFTQSVQGMVLPATVVAGAIGIMGKSAVDAASTAQQAMGGVEAVFGSSAEAVKGWASESADAVGLSSSAYSTMAAGIGGALTGLGVPLDDAANSTKDLIQRSADLASVFGGTTAQATEAVTSAYRGEYDALQRLIPGMSDAAVKQQMAADAADGMTFASEDAAKAHAITAVIMGKSAAAAGNFAKESDTAEGAQQRATAAAEDAQAALGAKLLPAVTAVTDAITAMANWVGENTTLVLILGGVLGTLAVGILGVNAAMAIFNAVMALNPIVLVVIAVAALVAGIVLLWTQCEGFRNFFIGMWEAVSGAAQAAWAWIQSAAESAWNAISGLVSGVAATIGSVVSAAGSVIGAVWDAISSAARTAWAAVSGVVSGVATAIGSAISSAGTTIQGIWDAISTAAGTAWSAVSSAVSTAVDAVVGFVQGIVDKVGAVWDAIQAAGEAVWGPIQSAAESAFGVIQGIIDDISGAISGVIGGIQSALSWVGDLWDKITNTPSPEVPPMGAPVVAAATSPSLARSGMLATGYATTSSRAASGTTVIVQGALDPDAVARQIADLLARRGRRMGGPELGWRAT